MAEPTFDHERLDVYRLSIDYVAFSYQIEVLEKSQIDGRVFRSHSAIATFRMGAVTGKRHYG